MRHPAITALATLSMFIWIPLHCTNDPISTAGGTDTGNAHAVAGRLYRSDGIKPAAGVAVAIRPRNTLADTSGFGLPKRMADTATVMTDDSGRFMFDSTLDTGTYVIEAASGNDAVLIDSVTVQDPDTTVDLPPDTLRPAGAIKSVIRLSEGGDPRKVFVLAFGIDRFARLEADGSFRFSSLAEAAYDLRIISSLDNYSVLDTFSIPVVSADTTDLDTLELPFTGIPTVKGLSLSYDTLKQIVTLSWNQADTSLIQGYNIYRTHADSTGNPAQLNAAVISDTVFRDSTALQDNAYTYQVKSVDRNGNEGLLSRGADVEVVSAFSFSKVFVPTGSNDGEVLVPVGIEANDLGELFVVDGANHRVQKFDSTGRFLLKIGKSSGKFITPVDLAVDTTGNIYVTDQKAVKKFDVTGAFDTAWITKGNAAAIAVSLEQHVYVATSGDESYVQVFGQAGDSIAQWKLPDGGRGIDILPSGQVYVSTRDATIGVYSRDGTLLHSWRLAASKQGCRLSVVDSLVYAPIGGFDRDYVAVVSVSGNLMARFGDGGPKSLSYPRDVAVIGDKIFVTDNNGIQLYQSP